MNISRAASSVPFMATVYPTDAHDQLVWLCGESALPLVNTGAQGAGQNLTASVGGAPTFAQQRGIKSGALIRPSTTDRIYGPNGVSVYEPTFPITISFWLYPTSFPSIAGGQKLFKKQYRAAAWSDPWSSLSFEGNGATTDGSWHFDIRTADGVTVSATGTAANALIANTWQHVGATYDGHTVRTFLNGKQVTTATSAGATQAIDYGTHGEWVIGNPVADNGSETMGFVIRDIRVATVARDISWFKAVTKAMLGWSM